MLIITTTRLLRLQERLLPHLLLPLLLILPQHKPIRSKPARYLCNLNLIPDGVAALLRLPHLARFVNLFTNYMRDTHVDPFAIQNARACVSKKLDVS